MQKNCPICSSSEQTYLFSQNGARIHRCAGCGLVASEQSSPTRQSRANPSGFETESDAAQRYAEIISEISPEHASILIVDTVRHPLANVLERRGFRVAVTAPNQLAQEQDGTWGCVVFLYSLERLADCAGALSDANRLLKNDGAVFVATPAVDSGSARFFGRSWVHWASANPVYFSRQTMQLLLEKQGFRSIWFQPDRRIFNVRHVLERLRNHHRTSISSLGAITTRITPKGLADQPVRLGTSGMLVTALKQAATPGPTLSIIMPVFNEAATVSQALTAVLRKEIRGVATREIIVVESNSTDGTRDIVSSFGDTPGVKLVLEPAPRGKGYAVRTGLAHATGDIVLIQDADTEYDINDYDELLAPLLERRELFVLGSRHQGDWKMRQFNDNPLLAWFFNLGQVLFTWLMNVLYNQNMTDPFTMYKVFRRECLFGLSFECNRFDFDHELVIKLIRKGYKPRELPVNYVSRSYSEGKKVSVFQDPLTWIKADFKYRFVSPYKPFVDSYTQARAESRNKDECTPRSQPNTVRALAESSMATQVSER